MVPIGCQKSILIMTYAKNVQHSYGQIKAYAPGGKGNAQVTLRGDKREVEVSFV